MKTTKLVVCLTLFLGLGLQGQQTDPAADQEPEEKEVGLSKLVARGFGVEVKMFFFPKAQFQDMNVSSVPEALRTVPTHQGDGWFGTPGRPRIVPDDPLFVLKPDLKNVGAVSVAPQYTVWRITFRGGVYFPYGDLTSRRPVAGDLSTYNAVNQYGDNNRGYGTSLVYYSIYWDDTKGRIKPFGEVEFRLHRFVSVIGGYGGTQSEYRLMLENGYDRFGRLEKYQEHELFRTSQKNAPYAAVRVGIAYIGVSVGVSRAKTTAVNNFQLSSTGGFRSFENQLYVAVDMRLTQTRSVK
ncbi:MAG: hypothetical protein COT91_03465 [Candidatus Doudnabacteria bacterium CG10_big_fil_rev_8_21_14_0_10_41_10]|uniref:Uncharacterized protein n=1 Tax=Candidatus Doudnabacteria bacterium CG10_big_fil_rev_8_21_14_0_10_41_10 TaxID=1974551 RepID=A0A2H0VFI5_9BACT|nr:MAG: hypothetical protein COT91_03465 [Candidatus Doudnabacteria bacterium CG10_big_fil_rev_8_21_14_0_10_41_10]